MKFSRNTLMAAALVAVSLSATSHSAYAEVVNLPASAALMNGDPVNSNCSVTSDPMYGIKAGEFGGICDLEFPIEVPVGRTIQQIEVVHGATALAGSPFINAYVSTLDFATIATETHYMWLGNPPPGSLQAKRLMQQTKGGGYLEAFVVQPSKMYQVVVHLEDGAAASGVRITYQ